MRSGDFSRMLEQFTEDAELAFEGVPVGPFRGKPAIAEAYAEQNDRAYRALQAAAGSGRIVAKTGL